MNDAQPALDIEIPFDHQQSAHCESGAIAALLRHGGLSISEPMAFGISGALTFAYLPFIKFGGLPLFAYRMPPGRVIHGLTRRLGIPMHYETFKHPAAGMQTLDQNLSELLTKGLINKEEARFRASNKAYWLSYFPPDMRFHFNAHNLIVYGKRGRNYLIGDPVIDIRVECDEDALKKARFTRGVMAPHGRLYYPLSVPKQPNLAPAIVKAIRFTAWMMLYTPIPIIGVHGIRMVARKLRKLNPNNAHRNKLLLGHIVRMQEEIGTGGAGFRFLYASFLQEAADVLAKPALFAIARDLTEVGDEWRRFALHAAKMCKGRMPMDYALLADQLRQCADSEAGIYRRLRAEVK